MKGKEKVGAQSGSDISVYLAGFFKVCGGKRCVFKEERNEGKVGLDLKLEGERISNR